MGDKGRGHVDLFQLTTWLRARFARDERGANLVEYMLLLVLIAIVVMVAIRFFGNQVAGKYSSTTSQIP